MAWTPNEEYLNALIEMGINRTAAEQVRSGLYRIYRYFQYALL